jgi:hypothetical protein
MEWISVEDELPDFGETVIVSGGIAYLTDGVWYSATGEANGEANGRIIQWKVTHWMPLPQLHE